MQSPSETTHNTGVGKPAEPLKIFAAEPPFYHLCATIRFSTVVGNSDPIPHARCTRGRRASPGQQKPGRMPVDRSHSNCLIQNMDPHYTVKDSATWSAEHPSASQALANSANKEVYSLRFGGSFAAGKCGHNASDTQEQLLRQQSLNSGLVSAALERLRGRKLVMLGDSIMLQQWLATLAMMAQLRSDFACPSLHGLYKRGWSGMPPWQCAQTLDWQRGVSGLRICYCHRHPWFSNLKKAVETFSREMHGQVDAAIQPEDVVLINSGLWHQDNLNTTRAAVGGFLKYLDDATSRNRAPTFFWRETSPQHFPEEFAIGACEDPPTCSHRHFQSAEDRQSPSCAPCSEETGWKGCQTAKDHNDVAASMLSGSGVGVVRIWRDSVADWSGHLGLIRNRAENATLDCSHYCLPSPTVINWTLSTFALLTNGTVAGLS